MAFSVVTQPAKYSPAYNHMTYRVYSSNNSQPLMKYVFDLYVNNTLVNTSKLFPRPDGYAHYDPSKIIQNYLTNTIYNEYNTYSFAQSSEVATYYVIFKEEYVYNNTLTTFTRSTGTTKHTWIGAANWEEGKNLTTFINQFIPNTANYAINNAAYSLGPKVYPEKSFVEGGFMIPTEAYRIGSVERRILSNMTRNTTYTYKYDRMNVLTIMKSPVGAAYVKLFYKNITTYTSDIARYQIIHHPVGIVQLNTGLTPILVPAGRHSYIDPDEDAYYMVWFSNIAANKITHRPVIFQIDDCNRFDKYTVMYKSDTGGWWYIVMNKKSNKSLSVSQSTMDTFLRYNYNYTDAVTKITSITAKGTYELSTDWLRNQGYVEEIEDMIKSPAVYLIDENGKYIPVIVKSKSYDIKNVGQDKLVNYTIEFEEAYDKNVIV